MSSGLAFRILHPIVSHSRSQRRCSVHAVHHSVEQVTRLSDAQLREETSILKGNARQNLSLSLLPKCTAIVFAAVQRCLGKSLYDVQLSGGLQLAQGKIAQMQTGEGKTLTTSIPAMFFALAGRGVHVATTNAYLAERDCEELRPVFEFLGLSVGLLAEKADHNEKRQAYACDLTFGTGYDFGFDYLRDQLLLRQQGGLPLGAKHLQTLFGIHKTPPAPVQRGHAYAIVDEVDSVLIDEATMPLILSSTGKAPCAPYVYQLAKSTAATLRIDDDYEIDEKEQKLNFTETGWHKLHGVLTYESTLPLNRSWSKYVENALRAELFLLRDVNYVVRDDAVQIVDQHTGRIHAERTWRDGLHQAIEIKEGVEVTAENASDARVSRQRYFQLYDQLCGMTGTATGVEGELFEFYKLRTEVIPTHRPSKREYYPPRTFLKSQVRNAAVVDEVLRMQQLARPVLVATRTIAHSLELSTMLADKKVKHQVLNGMQDAEEAAIVAQAGRSESVMIATNMAGRGTDIRLTAEAIQAGGLHVIGAEHNQSQRVDRQIVGRAARQGNPGSCQFFIAASDELLKHDERIIQRIESTVNADGESQRDLSTDIDRLQTRLELRQYEQRRKMVARDLWLDDVLETLASPHPKRKQ